MLIATGKIQNGRVQVDSDTLPEGGRVTVLVREGDETFELDPSEEARLREAIEEAEQGSVVSASDVLQQIRK